jgi:hypothetical protein
MLRDRIQPNSNVLLICCVTEQSLPSAEAVEYCHKIRSYFQGSTSRDASEKVQNQADSLDHNARQHFISHVVSYKQIVGAQQ